MRTSKCHSFFVLYYSTFSCLQEKVVKRIKNVPFYRFVSSAIWQNFLRLPELKFYGFAVKFTRSHGTFLQITDFLRAAKWCAPIFKAIRALRAFADHKNYANSYFASRFRGISQKSPRGEALSFRLKQEVRKPINPARIFASFWGLFLSKRKS